MTTTSPATAPQTTSPERPTGARNGVADGVVAGLLTVGLATLLAALMDRLGIAGGRPAPVAAVGEAFIDRTPPWLKDLAVAWFGTNDKRALLVGTVVVLALVCAAVGVLAQRRLRAGLLAFAAVGLVGLAAVVSRPNTGPLDVLPTLAGTLVGIAYLRRAHTAPGPLVTADGGVVSPARRWLLGGGIGAVAAYVGTVLGGSSSAASASRAAAAAAPALPGTRLQVPAGADLGVPGATPFVVPNDAFYRIDTAIVVPRVSTDDWKLKVTGLVEQEVEIDWNTLQSKPMQEALVTLTCVSNEVGGDLAGNAVWTGWPVRELLAMARPKAEADMVLSTSVDGWTCGTPVQALTDDRNALLAVRMNGEPLPFEHGFPVRLVVPGLYGYVSACKWVTEMRLTRFADDEGYWTPRGWSALGPIKTASRIDVPRSGAVVKAGKVAVAGVAWAQHRGISKVEVQVDTGPWVAARLAVDATIDAWRQWVYEWDAQPGVHAVRVRAYDASGQVQSPLEAPPAPDGATGIHTITVTVDA